MDALTEETAYVPVPAPRVEMPMFCRKPGCDRMGDHLGLCTPELVTLADIGSKVSEMHLVFKMMEPMLRTFIR